MAELSNQYRIPVGVEEFLLGAEFMDARAFLYPEVLDELVEINSGKYVEIVLTGGIGSAKTTAALYTTAYQLYLLSCYKSPHRQYKLDPHSEILFVFQSITETKARQVGYDRFRSMIETSKYFQTNFMYNKQLTSRLSFPKRVEVRPIGGGQFAAIGENVMGGLIDELNYMEVTEDSKKSLDGGTYDQAVSVYNSIARRRKSRFSQMGKLPGLLCLVSSRRYPGQFTDQKEAEAKTDPTIYVYDKCVWDIKPAGTFGAKRFQVFTGDHSTKPRVLMVDEYEMMTEDHQSLVRDIPYEYHHEFEVDIYDALREIAGVSTLATHPYFTNTEKVAAAFKKGVSVLSTDACDFVRMGLKVHPARFKNRDKPRWVHMDLALTGDRAGVAMGYVDRFIDVDRGNGLIETFPVIKMDFTLQVMAPPSGEIQFEKLRRLLYICRDEYQVDIRWVTFDGFQSADSIQILRQRGFVCGTISMDKDDRAYSITKTAMYDDRLELHPDENCQREFNQLERNAKKGNIDHPAGGSKDESDAVAGVVCGLSTRREVWSLYGTETMIPASLLDTMNKANVREQTVDEKIAMDV